jgi:hypothetical protein
VAGDLAPLARKIDKLEAELKAESKRAATRLGMDGKKAIESAVRSDVGDLSMSNWRRGKPIQIAGRYDIDGSQVTLTPMPRAIGPMRVLEEGRKAGVAKRRGGRKIRANARRAGRPVSASRAKNTWSDAEKIVRKGALDIVFKGVGPAIRKAFRG